MGDIWQAVKPNHSEYSFKPISVPDSHLPAVEGCTRRAQTLALATIARVFTDERIELLPAHYYSFCALVAKQLEERGEPSDHVSDDKIKEI